MTAQPTPETTGDDRQSHDFDSQKELHKQIIYLDGSDSWTKFEAPALLLRGEADDFEQGACADLIKGASTPPSDLHLKSYQGMAHEILFEDGLDMAPGKNRVVDDVVGWLHQFAGVEDGR